MCFPFAEVIFFTLFPFSSVEIKIGKIADRKYSPLSRIQITNCFYVRNMVCEEEKELGCMMR